tara:strand:- start:5458 stop:6006 length:549 start_codon:yes stop_codon:yes gene_type:complete
MKNEVTVGTILISKPFMEDNRFEKTIILIVEHNNDGTIGFIMNKITPNKIESILDILPVNNINLKYGGPVDDESSLFFIHRYPDLIRGSQEIKDGVFWGGEIEDVSKGLKSGEISKNEITFFLGYTGWEENQLLQEINEGSWIQHNIDLNQLKDNMNWSNLLIQINKEYEVWATAPSDFHLN